MPPLETVTAKCAASVRENEGFLFCIIKYLRHSSGYSAPLIILSTELLYLSLECVILSSELLYLDLSYVILSSELLYPSLSYMILSVEPVYLIM